MSFGESIVLDGAFGESVVFGEPIGYVVICITESVVNMVIGYSENSSSFAFTFDHTRRTNNNTKSLKLY